MLTDLSGATVLLKPALPYYTEQGKFASLAHATVVFFCAGNEVI